MKKRLIKLCILFGLLFPNVLLAQVNSVFWKISGKGIEKPSYIFGTHHLHSIDFIEENEDLLAILDSSDMVVGEIAIDSTNLGALSLKFFMAMMMKDNRLDSLLTPAQYQATDSCLKAQMGMGIATFNKVKPIFIYQLIMVSKVMKDQDNGPDLSRPAEVGNPIGNSMDGFFQQRASAHNIPVRGLESVNDQLDVLYNGYSLERQVEMLMEMVYDQNGNSTEEVQNLTEQYNQQNLSDLLETMEKNMESTELEKLLINRNNNWIPQIEDLVQKGKQVFFAVGAGHLPGSYGVLAQLKAKGYTLSPITIEIK